MHFNLNLILQPNKNTKTMNIEKPKLLKISSFLIIAITCLTFTLGDVAYGTGGWHKGGKKKDHGDKKYICRKIPSIEKKIIDLEKELKKHRRLLVKLKKTCKNGPPSCKPKPPKPPKPPTDPPSCGTKCGSSSTDID